MTGIREPQLAGTWYPGDAGALVMAVDDYIASAEKLAPERLDRLKAVIAPHAGYRYSGPVAGSAYAQVAAIGERISRVVLFGPSHHVGFRGLAVSGADAYRTPLGTVPIDRDAVRHLTGLPFVRPMDAAHVPEHSLEIHLPFLQRILGDFSLVPVVTGDASPSEVAEALAHLWGGPETLIVISTDLTHFLDYHTARRIDAATSSAITGCRPDAIGDDHACGRVGLKGLLEIGRRHFINVDVLDLRNSGDTSGRRDQVVGYGSWAATDVRDPVHKLEIIALGHRRALRRLAEQAIRHGLSTGREPDGPWDDTPPALTRAVASFVTLRKAEELRGCIGSAEAHRPLAQDVAVNAYKSAFHDPRFRPLEECEFGDLTIEIALLSAPQALNVNDENDLIERLTPGIDGLILDDGQKRAIFLPAVWQNLTEPRDFVRYLKEKAGWNADHWSPSINAHTFRAVKIAGAD